MFEVAFPVQLKHHSPTDELNIKGVLKGKGFSKFKVQLPIYVNDVLSNAKRNRTKSARKQSKKSASAEIAFSNCDCDIFSNKVNINSVLIFIRPFL